MGIDSDLEVGPEFFQVVPVDLCSGLMFQNEVLDADPRRVKRLRIATRKERSPARSQREGRRREATPEQGPAQANDNASPTPGDGAGSQ